MNEEAKRLKEGREETLFKWHKWGPYVSERSWGTVREDYSANGDAWASLNYERATSKAYRWGEDGIAGISDRYQVLVFAPVFWNGVDPLLKERLFGLSSKEGNHGEDVKEEYFHLMNTPTHSYMKYLYRYPQGEFPYQHLREENQKRGTEVGEYELRDTKIFENQKYFDIYIEYAKASEEDLVIRIEAFNRSDTEAPLHILPHLWFRNQWSWEDVRGKTPEISLIQEKETLCLKADDRELESPKKLIFDYHLNERYLYGPLNGTPLFTDNETSFEDSSFNQSKFLKDAFHRALIQKELTINPELKGTKSALHYFEKIPALSSVVFHFRLTDKKLKNPLKDVEPIFEKRREEAYHFYKNSSLPSELQKIKEKALSATLWSRQIYLFDVNTWLQGDSVKNPPPSSRLFIRNMHWNHLNSMRIMNVPDKWEYPWFAAWDQAFHSLTLGLVDLYGAKEHLWLLLHDQFQHPNGQIPACEWEFSDMNPPVQGWAALKLYEMEKKKTGKGDRAFLEKCFHKLLMNFSWWVNKVDPSGNNVFEGGFLGLDNITLFDRSVKFAGGVTFQQSDGTGWMAMFCLNLMRMALILARDNSVYEALAVKFFEHYVYIAHALKKRGNQNYELWSEKDGFFYDTLSHPDGSFTKCRLRSLVGIIPLFAIETLEAEEMERFPYFKNDVEWFMKNRPDLVDSCVISLEGKYVLTPMREDQLKSVLKYIWDPEEFRSPYGLRSLSKYHLNHPFEFQERKVSYEPSESLEKIKGGNSNWRGPIWFPTNYLLIDALKKIGTAFGDQLTIQVGKDAVNCEEMAFSFTQSLLKLFKNREFTEMEFFEYYNPETGKGLGARCQTGWTALIANLIDEWEEYFNNSEKVFSKNQ